MTGFARAAATHGAWRLAAELKCVNAKGADIRVRTPPGFDAIEAAARAIIAKVVVRGSCFATLTAQREGGESEPRINVDALVRLAEAAKAAATRAGLAPPTLDGLLGLRGIVETSEEKDDEEATKALHAAMLAMVEAGVADLEKARFAEGAALSLVLGRRLEAIAALTEAADANPARKPEAIRARLAEQVAALTQSTRGLDESRLHQEAIILATKADIREELDRLKTHVAAAKALLAQGGAIGRRLDFLSQELGREANTLCAKSNDSSLTAQGLELKAEIEQLREQAQNIE